MKEYKFVQSYPHIGQQYPTGISGLRVLILGESHYRQSGQDIYPQYTRDVVKEWNCYSSTRRFLGRIAGLFQFTTEQFLDSVAFYNYVQFSVGTAPRVRPKIEMWERSLPAFREVLTKHAPQFILVLGKGLWGELPGPEAPDIFEADVEVTLNRERRTACLYSTGGGRALLFAINHPSWPGWKRADWQPWVAPAMCQAAERTTGRDLGRS